MKAPNVKGKVASSKMEEQTSYYKVVKYEIENKKSKGESAIVNESAKKKVQNWNWKVESAKIKVSLKQIEKAKVRGN